MADSFTVNSVGQIGPETTPGTAVAATRALGGLIYMDTPKPTTHEFTPQGHAFTKEVYPGTEDAEFKISGVPTFDELIYPFCGLWGNVTPTIPTGGTNSRQWDWIPPLTNLQPGQTYTLERGSAARARRYAYLIHKGATVNLGKDDAKFDGDAFAQAIQTGFTLTPGLVSLSDIPVIGEQWSVFADPTSANIGTTQLLNPFSASFAYTDAFDPVYYLKRQDTSFSKVAPKKPKVELKLKLEADSVGDSYFTNLRNSGTPVYVRLQAIGPIIEGTIAYLFQIDLCCKPLSPSEFGDDEGMEALEWTFRVAEDPAWNSGRAMHVTLINQQASL
jgi:hypothetical protein